MTRSYHSTAPNTLTKEQQREVAKQMTNQTDPRDARIASLEAMYETRKDEAEHFIAKCNELEAVLLDIKSDLEYGGTDRFDFPSIIAKIAAVTSAQREVAK